MNNLVPTSCKRVGRHFLFWLCYILYLIVGDGWTDNDSWNLQLSPELLTTLLVVLPLVYLNLYGLMPALFIKRKYMYYGFTLLLLIAGGGLLIRFFAYWLWLPMERGLHPDSLQPNHFWILARIIKDMVEVFPVMALTMVFKLMRNTSRQESRLRAIEREKFNAEMGMLKAQLNPHFFFNTLNSLYALTLENSPKSPEMVLRLADLMRYMLYESNGNKVLLKNELEHLKNYIAIERLRFGERLDLSFQYSGDLDGKWIAPLLLLPFIENAFKHGVENKKGWVTIDLKGAENRLYLKVENSFAGLIVDKSTGVGLGNVKRRLALLYPARYVLTTALDHDVYLVDLKIEL